MQCIEFIGCNLIARLSYREAFSFYTSKVENYHRTSTAHSPYSFLEILTEGQNQRREGYHSSSKPEDLCQQCSGRGNGVPHNGCMSAWQTIITCIEVDFKEMQMHHQAASVCSSAVAAEHKAKHAHIDALAGGRGHIIMNDPEVIIPPNPNFSSASSPSPSSSSSKPEDIIMKEPIITELNRAHPPEHTCQCTGSYEFFRKTRCPLSLSLIQAQREPDPKTRQIHDARANKAQKVRMQHRW